MNFSLSLPPSLSLSLFSLVLSPTISERLQLSQRRGAANQLGTHERSASERARLSVTTRLIRRHCQRPCHAVDTPVLLGLPKLSNQVGEACVRTSLQLRTSYARRNDVFATLLLSGTIATCRRRSKARETKRMQNTILTDIPLVRVKSACVPEVSFFSHLSG